MTDQSTTETPPSFGSWVVVIGDDVDGFPAGTKALVTSSGCDSNGFILVSRPAANGQTAPVVRSIPCDDVTADLSWRPLREEQAIQSLIQGIYEWTASRIDRSSAIELLAEVDKAREATS